ncbi:MAG: hypothetical protein LCH26_07415 [Proteobacteria bacterium]|nr:hypothetical protein [Pseudomonadota bacterium]
MLRSLSFAALLGVSFFTPSQAKVNFNVDERGFEACYDSFINQVRPGTPISTKAFAAIADALEEKGNVIQKMNARENQRVVLDQRKRKAFMDNVQGKGQVNKRARLDNDFFQKPANVPANAEAVKPTHKTQGRKRAWRVRYDEKLIAPVAQLLAPLDAMDIIEEMFTPVPRNIVFLANQTKNQEASAQAQNSPKRQLVRQNANVGTHFAPLIKTLNQEVAQNTPSPSMDQPLSLVKSRISFWENVSK